MTIFVLTKHPTFFRKHTSAESIRIKFVTIVHFGNKKSVGSVWFFLWTFFVKVNNRGNFCVNRFIRNMFPDNVGYDVTSKTDFFSRILIRFLKDRAPFCCLFLPKASMNTLNFRNINYIWGVLLTKNIGHILDSRKFDHFWERSNQDLESCHYNYRNEIPKSRHVLKICKDINILPRVWHHKQCVTYTKLMFISL